MPSTYDIKQDNEIKDLMYYVHELDRRIEALEKKANPNK